MRGARKGRRHLSAVNYKDQSRFFSPFFTFFHFSSPHFFHFLNFPTFRHATLFPSRPTAPPQKALRNAFLRARWSSAAMAWLGLAWLGERTERGRQHSAKPSQAIIPPAPTPVGMGRQHSAKPSQAIIPPAPTPLGMGRQHSAKPSQAIIPPAPTPLGMGRQRSGWLGCDGLAKGRKGRGIGRRRNMFIVLGRRGPTSLLLPFSHPKEIKFHCTYVTRVLGKNPNEGGLGKGCAT
jgi:hypothetical protein